MFRHRRGLTTGGALHRNHRLWCQIQGGGKRRSGATLIDDNAVDDAIAGEADRRSPPAVSPYTHLRVATLLQMRFSAYHGDAMLHGASNRRYILIAGSSNWLFLCHKTSNTELTTGSDFCPESYEVVAYRPEFSVCRNADSSNCMLLYINIKHSATMAYIRIILTQILPLDSICAII